MYGINGNIKVSLPQYTDFRLSSIVRVFHWMGGEESQKHNIYLVNMSIIIMNRYNNYLYQNINILL